ncbi:MAG TPA: dual specificity protein phosphatase family protein [Tepidisphaeraceae bacterium]|jgi:protein-tyrosine phosphatase|nr:dual specificity protein phosphatase family protein [Tepidisphaeraceae bacterium]
MDPLKQIVQMDDDGMLFLSAAIQDWNPIANLGIETVIDLDGGVDQGVPEIADKSLYIYLPIADGNLPDLNRLHAVAKLGADLIRQNHRVLTHCGVGLNRSALMAGLILRYLGLDAQTTIQQCRQRRPGALYNPVFAEYLANCSMPALA